MDAFRKEEIFSEIWGLAAAYLFRRMAKASQLVGLQEKQSLDEQLQMARSQCSLGQTIRGSKEEV